MKIRLNPKKKGVENAEWMNERQRETQEVYCDEIRSLRCELETMKTAMDEMRQQMNEMRLNFQSVGLHNTTRSFDHNIATTMQYSHDSLNQPVSNFEEWINGLEITVRDLEIMFDSKDAVEWASKFIVADLKQRSSPPYPLCAIKGSRNELLMYDKDGVWKKITDQEFASTVVKKVFKKLISVFTEWKNENYSRILTSERFSTLYHSNYARILSFNENASKLKIKLFHEL
jgi:hypothetical protein